MTIKAIALASLALLFAACGVDDPEPTGIVDSRDYYNKAIGLSMRFPSGWVIKHNQEFGEFTADIVASSLPSNGFSPNMNVIIIAHSGSTEMPDIISQVKAQLEANFQDLSGYHDSLYAINGTDVGQVQYESAASGVQLHYLQLFFIKNGQDVACSFGDRADAFDANADIKSIKASIKIQ